MANNLSTLADLQNNLAECGIWLERVSPEEAISMLIDLTAEVQAAVTSGLLAPTTGNARLLHSLVNALVDVEVNLDGSFFLNHVKINRAYGKALKLARTVRDAMNTYVSAVGI